MSSKQLYAYLLLLSGLFLLLGSCVKIDRHSGSLEPQINFTQTRFFIAKDETIKIPVKLDVAPTTETRLSYEIKGNLEQGVDYRITPEQLTFGPNKDTDTLYINRLTESNESVDLTVTIPSAPVGYRVGLINFVLVRFVGRSIGMVTFDNEVERLGRQLSVSVRLRNDKGYLLSAPQDLNFAISVDPLSTAVENKHYEFVDKATAHFKARSREALIPIRFLKKEEGKDKIVLSLIPRSGYTLGNYPKVTILIDGPLDLSGTWAYDSLYTYPSMNWFETARLAPFGVKDDKITFSGTPDSYTYTVDIKGGLQAYFNGNGTATFTKDRVLPLQEQMGKKQIYSFYTMSNINVNISPTSQTIRPAEVGFRKFIDNNDREILEVFVVDIVPAPDGFLSDLYEWFKDDPTFDYPMTYANVRYHFVRQK